MPEVALGRERREGIGPDVMRGGCTGGWGDRAEKNVKGVAFRSTLDRKGALLVYLTERRAGHLSDKNFAESSGNCTSVSLFSYPS